MVGNYRLQDNLGETGQDLLGFTDIAGRLADVLIDPAVAGGIVLGLEGTWGSGKSHLVGLTKRELSKRQGAVCFDFRPWLVGNRDELLDAFFADLRSVIELHCDNGGAVRKNEVDNVLNKLLGYSARFGRLAPLVKLSGLVGVPGATQVETFMQQLAKLGELGKGAEPLLVVKDEISTALAKFSTRIVVFIDDVDRLEPSEIIEVLRLVRSVADFPNLVYVLCYDAAVVSEAITCETKAGDGRAYLAKIVQIPVLVPESEPFALRRMLESGLAEIWDGIDPSSAERLPIQLDYSTHRLRTPRDVNRVLDAVRFLWPALRGRADFVDLCGLQLIKNSNPALYQAIETLCAYFAELQISFNRRTSPEREKQILEDMRKALLTEGLTLAEIPRDVVALAPKFTIKLSTDSSKIDELNSLRFSMQEAALASAASGKRLASPDYYRLYFALAAPKGAPQKDDFDALRDALRTKGEEASDLLQRWFEEPTFYDGTTKGREVLKRIERQSFGSLDHDEAKVFIVALAKTMDQCAPAEWTMHERPDDWYYAGKALGFLASSNPGNWFRSAIDSAFKDGSTIC
jgi:KAP-like P-loop domain-containing protein